jgi:hypothetical protein
MRRTVAECFGCLWQQKQTAQRILHGRRQNGHCDLSDGPLQIAEVAWSIPPFLIPEFRFEVEPMSGSKILPIGPLRYLLFKNL